MRSLLSLLLLLALPAHGQSVQLLVQSSPLAGFRHAEAAAVMPLMQLNDALDLVREQDNPHDPDAVRVDWRGRKLGYVPRRQNAALGLGTGSRYAAPRAREPPGRSSQPRAADRARGLHRVK